MQGKKSFILYADLIHMVKKLPKDKQADLFVMILEYVNDENPVTDDVLLDVAFEPIRRQLKRDLVKYEERAKRSRENGKKGGRPPLDNPEEPKQPSGLIGNPEEPRKPDSVNGTVNVNGNVNANNNRAFVADVNQDKIQYRNYLESVISGKQISRDQLFMKEKVDPSKGSMIWSDFLKNSAVHVPLIEDEKHAWNTFKRFIQDNSSKYRFSDNTFKGF